MRIMKAEIENDWLPTRQTLLSRLKDWDDADSWREFFETYSKLIYSVARRAGLADSEAQEVVQETLITVSNKMPDFRYDPKRGSFKGWLRNTAQWKIQDQLRRRQRQSRLQDVSRAQMDGESEAIDSEHDEDFDKIWLKEWEEHMMKTALGRIKKLVAPKEFQVFDFCTLKGWTAARIAKELRLFRPQVYYLNRKVSKLLQRELLHLQTELPQAG